MGKTILNSALAKLSGRIDGWVYRRRKGEMVVSKRPDFSGAPTSASQLETRQRFKLAAAYAEQVLKDPVQRAFYAQKAEDTTSNAFAQALGDHMKPPTVVSLDVSGYHGGVGNVIAVQAVDDTEVVRVWVSIRDEHDAVLEEGEAEAKNGRWEYVTTASVPSGATVMVEAAATDRPGNTGRKLVTAVAE